jgi:hypothetical protein
VVFYFFGGSSGYKLKKVFLPVNDQLAWLDSVIGFFQGGHFLEHFFKHRPLLPIGLKILQTVRQRQRKTY